MSRRAQDNLMCLLSILVFSAFVVLSFQYSARARMVPVPIAAISILLLLLQLYFQNFRTDIKLNVDSMDLFKISEDAFGGEEEVAEAGQKKKRNARSEFDAFAMVFVFFLMVLLIGMLESLFLFVLGYFLMYSKEKLYVALAWSAGSTAALYFLFFRLINIAPYEGWIRLTFFS